MATELLRRYQVIEMILRKKKTTPGYAGRLLQIHVMDGRITPYPNRLKQGTRSERLYDPVEVNRWLNTL